MNIYTQEDFDESNSDNIIDSGDNQEEEISDRSEIEGSQEEEYDEEDENDEEDLIQNPADEVLVRSSTQTRCTILKEEIRLLRLENELLLSRENSLKQKLEIYNEDNESLKSKLLESEKNAANLNKEIELIRCRSEARQSTLENSYRDLCSKIAKSEEANQKMRFSLNEQKAKNSVLEELVESKNTAIAELERRLKHLTPASSVSVRLNGTHQQLDNVKQLTYRLHATEQQLDLVVSELSKVVSYNNHFKNTLHTHTHKYFDYNAMLKDYNSKCIKLKELEERLVTDDNKTKISVLEDEIRVLNQKLASRINMMKNNDKELKEFYAKQMEELKSMVSDQKMEVVSRQEEVTKLEGENRTLRFQLDHTNKALMDKSEQLEQIKSQYQTLGLENEALKAKLEDLMKKARGMKMELQIVLDREQTHMTEFKNYVNETDLKLKKMELVIMHNQEVENKVRQREEEKEEKKIEQDQLGVKFKQELMDELGEVKHLINSLEKSKKEQQQINNLILTLRHQNDTLINTLKDENKNTINSISEKNTSNLSEIKQESNRVVETVKDKINTITESFSKLDESLLNEVRQQFELLKEEFKTICEEIVKKQEEKRVEAPPQQACDNPELEDKYNKLKESFKNTTASLLRKEKILLDSLKKTVLECHNYKEKLEKLSGVTHEQKKCNCIALIKDEQSRLKSYKNCWCKLKSNNILRLSIAKRARDCESATLDSIKLNKNKKPSCHTCMLRGPGAGGQARCATPRLAVLTESNPANPVTHGLHLPNLN